MGVHTRSRPSIRVWDLPVRVFHWLLVVLVALAWVSGEAEGSGFVVHQLAGYGVLVAIVFRVLWGFMGSRHARFSDFLRPWRVVWDYAKRLAALSPPRSLGHNPLGGWMILLLLGTLAVLVVTGLFAGEEGLGGPLRGTVSPSMAEGLAEVHEGLTVFLLVLIGIHVAGVGADSLLTRDNLVWAMLTGRKEVSAEEAAR
jgi:cytochrome b